MKLAYLYTKSELTPWKENIHLQTLQYLQNNTPESLFSDVIHFDGFTESMADVLHQYDLVFNLCYGYGTAGQVEVAQWLENHNIPHTASSSKAMATAQNKALLPEICRQLGLATPALEVNPDGLHNNEIYLAKPRLGSCHRDITIHSGQWMKENQQLLVNDCIIQPYIFGREFSVAVIPAPGGRYSHGLPPIEICSEDQSTIFVAGQSFGPTYRNLAPKLKESLVDDLMEAAEKLHRFIGLRGMSRTDFRVDQSGNIFVLDVNAMPNLDPEKSLLPAICQHHGIQMKDVIQRILDNYYCHQKIAHIMPAIA
ncbi:MAG: ATP-grasp domain-containing protein [Saprospiraceae bacterium]|jgi:D-alanine-D-alanine ligase|nr:ATP-grasp domain-containing protein [Saprospiraceae bacterium]